MPPWIFTDSYASAFLRPGFSTIFISDATRAQCWKQARSREKSFAGELFSLNLFVM